MHEPATMFNEGGAAGSVPTLSDQQREQFVRDGFVLVPGLIAQDTVATTRSAILDALAIAPDDPATWDKADITPQAELLELTAPCRTPAVEAVVEQLVGPHFLPEVTYAPFLESHGMQSKLYRGFTPVIRFPRPGPREFVKPHSYHIDGMHRTSLWPVDIYLVIFAYLTDVAEYGGATVVLPGSHRQVFAHWHTQSHPGSTHPPELEYAEPLAVPGKAGDVIFMHYLTVHSGSENRADYIRVGLNTSVVPDAERPYTRKEGPPEPGWTLMDMTLRTDNLG